MYMKYKKLDYKSHINLEKSDVQSLGFTILEFLGYEIEELNYNVEKLN